MCRTKKMSRVREVSEAYRIHRTIRLKVSVLSYKDKEI